MKTGLYKFEDLDSHTLASLSALRDSSDRYDSPFFDLEFARQLSRVRDDTRLGILVDAGGFAGVWPMHVRPDRWARPIGAAFSDWHGPVMREDRRGDPADAFLQALDVKGMSINGLSIEPFRLQDGQSRVPVGFALLDASGAEGFLTNQKQCFPKYAKNIRRAERLIEQNFDQFVFTADDKSAEALDWLLTSKSAQYKATGLHDVLGPRWVQSLMRNLFVCKTARFSGRLSTLRVDNTLIAAEFDILSDTTVHGWITAYDQAYARYSPGHLLIHAIIKDADRTGHYRIDMGTGDSAYKKYYETYVELAAGGTVRSKHGLRPLAASWRSAEAHLPPKLSNTMARMRRRTDQIAGTELSPTGRLQGFVAALRKSV